MLKWDTPDLASILHQQDSHRWLVCRNILILMVTRNYFEIQYSIFFCSIFPTDRQSSVICLEYRIKNIEHSVGVLWTECRSECFRQRLIIYLIRILILRLFFTVQCHPKLIGLFEMAFWIFDFGMRVYFRHELIPDRKR